MNDETQLWERVDAALDARVNPLEDDAVQTILMREPERTREVCALVDDLERVALEPLVPAPDARSERRLARVLIGVAATSLVAFGLWRSFARENQALAPTTRVVDPEARVVSFRVDFESSSAAASARSSVELVGRRLVRGDSMRVEPALPEAMHEDTSIGWLAAALTIHTQQR